MVMVIVMVMVQMIVASMASMVMKVMTMMVQMMRILGIVVGIVVVVIIVTQEWRWKVVVIFVVIDIAIVVAIDIIVAAGVCGIVVAFPKSFGTVSPDGTVRIRIERGVSSGRIVVVIALARASSSTPVPVVVQWGMVSHGRSQRRRQVHHIVFVRGDGIIPRCRPDRRQKRRGATARLVVPLDA